MPKHLLSEQDRKAIADTIAAAESRTSGEIVFALAEASSSYQHAALLGAIFGMAGISTLYLIFPMVHTINMVLWVELVSFAVLYAVLTNLSCRRWFIPGREMDARTREAAFFEFYSRGLYRTRESNGVLIFLSQLERRVVILGDKAIHEKMGDRHWDEIRDKIIEGIHSGKAREGICAAIECCGEALARHFPHRPDDTNELPNSVVDHRI
jgi:putative membrane protein